MSQALYHSGVRHYFWYNLSNTRRWLLDRRFCQQFPRWPPMPCQAFFRSHFPVLMFATISTIFYCASTHWVLNTCYPKTYLTIIFLSPTVDPFHPPLLPNEPLTLSQTAIHIKIHRNPETTPFRYFPHFPPPTAVLQLLHIYLLPLSQADHCRNYYSHIFHHL